MWQDDSDPKVREISPNRLQSGRHIRVAGDEDQLLDLFSAHTMLLSRELVHRNADPDIRFFLFEMPDIDLVASIRWAVS